MMASLLICFSVGIFTVLQPGLNKQIGQDYGVAGAALINSFFTLVFALIAYWIINETKLFELHDHLRATAARTLKWWYCLPGLFGFFIIFGIPYGIIHVGALRAMTLMICAQIITSILWDASIEGIAVSPLRLIGGMLTFLGALLVSLK